MGEWPPSYRVPSSRTPSEVVRLTRSTSTAGGVARGGCCIVHAHNRNTPAAIGMRKCESGRWIFMIASLAVGALGGACVIHYRARGRCLADVLVLLI